MFNEYYTYSVFQFFMIKYFVVKNLKHGENATVS